MDPKYSVDDILKELESRKSTSAVSEDDFQEIMAEVLGRPAPSVQKAAAAEPVSAPAENSSARQGTLPAEKNIDKKQTSDFLKTAQEGLSFQKTHESETSKGIASGDSSPEDMEKTLPFQPVWRERTAAVSEEASVEQDAAPSESNTRPPAVPEKADDGARADKPETPSRHPAPFEDKTIQMQPFGLNCDSAPLQESEMSSGSLEETQAFLENRKQKIEKFVLFGEEEEDNDPEQEEPTSVDTEVKTLEDFNDYSESTAILKDLSGMKAGLTLRLIVLLALTAVSAYLELASRFRLPLPEFLMRDLQPVSFLLVSALLFVAAVIVSLPAVIGGVASLFRLKADADALAAVGVLGCVVQYVALFLSPQYIATSQKTVYTYGVVLIFCLLMNTVGKLLMLRRVRLNFRFVSGGYEKTAVGASENEKMTEFVKEEFSASYACLSAPKRTDFIGGFLGYSYREDPSDRVAKILAPLIAFGALLLAGYNFLVERDITRSAGIFAVVCSICTPASALLSVNYPLARAAKKLVSRGAMISSMAACNELYDTNAILVRSSDLFPKGSIQLSAIKTFAAGKIDDVILDAASVAIQAKSDLSDVFLSVIGGRTDLLRPVDSIVYEEAMGLSAWVDSKRVLIGNRELIRHHGIAVPSKDYEDRYLNAGTDMVYLAASGELAAVFLIQYKPGKQVKRAMRALSRLGIGLIVSSTDPNINAEKMARIFETDQSMIRTVPVRLQAESEQILRPSARENVGTACISSFPSFVQTVYAAIRLKSIAALAVSLQTVGCILGFALAAFFIFLSGSLQLSAGAVLLYQLFWLAAVCLLPSPRRIKI